MGSDKYTGALSPASDGSVTLISTKKLADCVEELPQFYIQELYRAIGNDGGKGYKPAQQLRVFKKYVPLLIKAFFALQEALGASTKNEERIYATTAEKSHKRWTPEEDELLIEIAAAGRMSAVQIAIAMGRTPGAVQTRVSQLVGIGKLSQEIAGRFIGTIDGETVDGYVDGTVWKGQATS